MAGSFTEWSSLSLAVAVSIQSYASYVEPPGFGRWRLARLLVYTWLFGGDVDPVVIACDAFAVSFIG